MAALYSSVAFSRWVLPAALAAAAIGTAFLLPGSPWPLLVTAMLAAYLAFRLGHGPLGRGVSRSKLSLRWKVSGAVLLILVIFVAVGAVGLAIMEYMHREVHKVDALAGFRPPEVTAAIEKAQGPQGELLLRIDARRAEVITALERLERVQHSILYWTPGVMALGGITALALGTALSRATVPAVERMGEAARRIARGDFSQPVTVDNGDELGELAERLNGAAADLTKLREAMMAEERARALQERMAETARAQEEERRRISRELHDGLGPSLSALGNRLRTCQQLVRTDPAKSQAELDNVIVLLRRHVQEIRSLIHELRPIDLDQLGLAAAVSEVVEQFGSQSGIQAAFETSGTMPSDPLIELTVYRVVQEALTNVQRHAGASKVDVALMATDQAVDVRITDNGKGFDAEGQESDSRGHGLTNMRERGELVGGVLSVVSTPNAGCSVWLRVPLRAPATDGPSAARIGN
ncbi:MAG: HAMP domain-containing protein [Chloroflexi bacterium]|nr:HAMP domain-containing protein [Chloroflexota bacterium]